MNYQNVSKYFQSMVSIIRHVSIKRTVCKYLHMTLLNINYNLKIA